jgi:hypothetical protein
MSLTLGRQTARQCTWRPLGVHSYKRDTGSVTGLLLAPSYGLPRISYVARIGSHPLVDLGICLFLDTHIRGDEEGTHFPLACLIIEGLTSPQLSHIPSLGFSDPILSYWSALRYVLDPPGFLRREWQRVRIYPFQKHEMTDIAMLSVP